MWKLASPVCDFGSARSSSEPSAEITFDSRRPTALWPRSHTRAHARSVTLDSCEGASLRATLSQSARWTLRRFCHTARLQPRYCDTVHLGPGNTHTWALRKCRCFYTRCTIETALRLPAPINAVCPRFFGSNACLDSLAQARVNLGYNAGLHGTASSLCPFASAFRDKLQSRLGSRCKRLSPRHLPNSTSK